MNCPECHDLLQRRLDGRAGPGPGALERHLAACPECRDWHQAARLLEEGLAALPRPVPPPGLAGRVVAAAALERRLRLRRRQRVLVAAAAACLLLTPLAVALLGRLAGPEPAPAPAPVARHAPRRPAPAPSLEESVGEAGSAVAALSERLAGQTRQQARLLWGVAPRDLAAPLPDLTALPSPLDPATRPLREAGQGVSAGLETVASSARRAVSWFAREIPGLDRGRKTLD